LIITDRGLIGWQHNNDLQVAVKILAANDITEAAMNKFKQAMDKLQAVRGCTKACRVFGYCLKQEQPCLVMLRYKMCFAGCKACQHTLFQSSSQCGTVL